MFPWRVGGRDVQAYAPGWDLLDHGYEHCTLDFSHAATARQDSMQLLEVLGDRVRHLHLTDGSGSLMDEHLVPGDGTQPVAEVLEKLAAAGWDGHTGRGDQHPAGQGQPGRRAAPQPGVRAAAPRGRRPTGGG
jgi:hypothetical protein